MHRSEHRRETSSSLGPCNSYQWLLSHLPAWQKLRFWAAAAGSRWLQCALSLTNRFLGTHEGPPCRQALYAQQWFLSPPLPNSSEPRMSQKPRTPPSPLADLFAALRAVECCPRCEFSPPLPVTPAASLLQKLPNEGSQVAPSLPPYLPCAINLLFPGLLQEHLKSLSTMFQVLILVHGPIV